MFLDETGTPVVMPRLTFEELDRLQRLDLGIQGSEERHQIERIDIQARVNGNRVAMEVVIDLRLEPPVRQVASNGTLSSRTYSIDLAMSDLHLVQVLSVDGISNARFSFEERGETASAGYRLRVPWASSGDLRLRLKMSTAVTRQGLNQATLNLNLPRAPTKVDLKIDARDQLRWWDRELRLTGEPLAPGATVVTAEIVGNRRDLIRPMEDARSGRFAIESNGGELGVLWQVTSEGNATDILMESKVDATLDWSTPDDGVTMRARIEATHLRNELTAFTVLLPPNLALIGTPSVVPGDLSALSDDSEAGVGDASWRVLVGAKGDVVKSNRANTRTDNEGTGNANSLVPIIARRIPASSNSDPRPGDMRSAVMILQLRLLKSNVNASNPMMVRLPVLHDSLSSEGTLQIITGDSSQLRWRVSDGVSVLLANNESDVGPSYQFQFNAPESTLPVWLSRQLQRKPLRVSGQLEIDPGQERLALRVQSLVGPLAPEAIRLIPGDWRLVEVTPVDSDTSTSDPLLIAEDQAGVQWQLNPDAVEVPTGYALTLVSMRGQSGDAVGPLERNDDAGASASELDGSAMIRLPTLEAADETIQIGDVRLAVSGSRGQVWVTDVNASLGVRNRPGFPKEVTVSGDASAPVLVGRLVPMPTEIELEAAASMNWGNVGWEVRHRWNLSPSADLGGRLSIQSSEPLGGDRFVTAFVDGTPAIVDVDESGNAAIVSPRLNQQPVRIEIVDRVQRTLDSSAIEVPEDQSPARNAVGETRPDQIALIASVKPAVDQIVYGAPFELSVPHRRVDDKGELWRVSVERDEAQRGSMELLVAPADASEMGGAAGDSSSTASLTPTSPMQTWRFAAIPETSTELALQRDLSNASSVTVDRACLRSFVGNRTRQEQLIATVTGENIIRVGLPSGLPSMSVEARLDNREIEVRRDASGLRVDLRPTDRRPSATATHVLDIRVWLPWDDNTWWLRVAPLMRLPLGTGQMVWELIVPADRHLVWASSTSGRAMRWQRDRLRMARVPVVNDAELVKWASAVRGPLPGVFSAMEGVAETRDESRAADDALNAIPGNRYLFYAGDTFAFSGGVISRTWLWLIVGLSVLGLAAALNFQAGLWHPLTAIATALLLTGLMVVAPDAVILAGQLAAFSMTLVVVLYAVAKLLGPQTQQRVLAPSRHQSETGRSRAGSPVRVGATGASSVRQSVDSSHASHDFSFDRRDELGSASDPTRERETVLAPSSGVDGRSKPVDDSNRQSRVDEGFAETQSMPAERTADKRSESSDSQNPTTSGTGTI
ncbi:MAG: DoxX family protein [Planctomycetota bacterium]